MTNTEITMTRPEYNELMEKISEGGKINQKTYDEMMAFAKAKKAKRPSEDAVITEADVIEVKEASTTKAKRTKEPVKCSVTASEDPKMAEGETCQAMSRSNGMCAKHYSRLIHRAKPENREKANQASKNYAKRLREEKAALKAAAETTETAETAE